MLYRKITKLIEEYLSSDSDRMLVIEGARQIGKSYIIRHVGEYGLYIFLAPHICMPHCKEFQYVKEAGMCIMKCNQPVYPDPNDPELYAELFFPIAAKSEGAHLDSIQDLMEILDDEETVEALLAAKTKEDFERLVNEQ